MKPSRPALLRFLGLAPALVVLAAASTPGFANPSFEPLLGSWGGSGTYRLQDGTSERLKCDAYYTGSGTQLGIAVRCSGKSNKIEMRSKVSSNSGALSGSWEERTYNASGNVTGKLTEQNLTLTITGGVAGSM